MPVHIIFPQILKITEKYMKDKVQALGSAEKVDVFMAPYYGYVIETLTNAIRPDTSKDEAPEVPRYEQHRGPGSTAEVDIWTTKEVWPVEKSHLNYIVADTRQWEQSASFFIDTHPCVESFVKNAGLGFAIPYFYNGEPHDYIPDFIVRVKAKSQKEKLTNLILETKGFDTLEEIKVGAARRWVAAVNADGKFGKWAYEIAKKPTDVTLLISNLAGE
jgi:type III restriction enzyme